MNSIIILFFILFESSVGVKVLDNKYWKESALEDLYETIEYGHNMNIAKNIIIFIGDGMCPNTITASRIYSEGETGYLAWERFPHVGGIKTYAANKQVPDSANTATALYTGIKVNKGTLGVDSAVQQGDCEAALVEKNKLTTIARYAQEAGKYTGVITTTRVTHATPAAMYANTPHRDWECDSTIPAGCGVKDIGRQLVEDLPGKKLNVIMGGGRQMLMANPPDLPNDPVSSHCKRTDGRNLIAEWAEAKSAEGARYALPNNTRDLLNVDLSQTEYLLGVFNNTYLPHEYMRDKSETGVPSLEQMTHTAVKLMMKNKNGFVLMVEGGLIDVAHHDGRARVALEEVVAFNDAINSTMKLLRDTGIEEETLVIVTSDHAHTLTISGYPDIGNDILGIADKSGADGVPYTTLGYANSVKNNYHYTAVNGTVVREDPSKVDTTSRDYGFQAAILNSGNTHGGNDVFIYASGPHAHLFHRIHEQNYVGVAMRYAARVGEFTAVPPHSTHTHDESTHTHDESAHTHDESTHTHAEPTSSSSSILSSVILLFATQFVYLL